MKLIDILSLNKFSEYICMNMYVIFYLVRVILKTSTQKRKSYASVKKCNYYASV